VRTQLDAIQAVRAASGDTGMMRPVISALLRYGVVLSAAVTLVGLGLLLIQVGPKAFVSMPSIRAPETTDLTSLRAVLRELVPPEPEAVMDAGILLLIATPAVTVGTAAISFALEKDWLYVGITTFVFAMLMLGFAVGRGIAAGKS
jgi:uncharacterized membrane protein